MYLRIFWRVPMNLQKNPAFCRKIRAFTRKIRYEYGQKQGDKSSPLLFGLVFNALLLAQKATGVGHSTITGLRAPARGFA